MKRVGYILEKIADIDNLNRALNHACKRKKHKPFVREVLAHRDQYLQRLHDDIMAGTLELSVFSELLIYDHSSHKERFIRVPKFYPDQVLHWAVCLALKPVFMRGMYAYCIGSVPGRGGKCGKKYIEKVYRRDRKVKYAMKTDVRKFFPSVSNEKMKALLRTKIKDKRALALIDAIIDSGGDGLPIGFYTSQWLSNFYLEKVDHYIKEDLHIRHYVRNVDDMTFLDTNKRKLHRALRSIMAYLADGGYRCRIKDNWQVFPTAARPLDFLGYQFSRGKTMLRKRNYLSLMRRVRRVKKRGYCTVARARAITSLLGMIKHLPHGKHLYTTYIKPTISKGEMRRIVSKYDKLHPKGGMLYGHQRQYQPCRGTA